MKDDKRTLIKKTFFFLFINRSCNKHCLCNHTLISMCLCLTVSLKYIYIWWIWFIKKQLLLHGRYTFYQFMYFFRNQFWHCGCEHSVLLFELLELNIVITSYFQNNNSPRKDILSSFSDLHVILK